MAYQPTYRLRFVTATSLFDGHDAAINIFRRLLQASGAEVIHLGHNRSAQEIVDAAIEEDANAMAVTSYQGGHIEFFRYLRDLTVAQECDHIRIFGGGGGTILPEEGDALAEYGISRIYSPDDGRRLGLQGMVDDMLTRADFPTGELNGFDLEDRLDNREVARLISAAENFPEKYQDLFEEIGRRATGSGALILGVSGTGGSGKSTVVDEMVSRFLSDFSDKRLAVLSVDPSRRRSGGALLGDRIRMNAVLHPRVYMRSMATRQSNVSLSPHVARAVEILKAAGFDLIFLETSGIGQSDTEIIDQADVSLYVMTPEYGAATQLEKIDMLDYADLVVINKADKLGAADALREVRKQVRRNRKAYETADELPVHLTYASEFNDPGTNRLYAAMLGAIREETNVPWTAASVRPDTGTHAPVVPAARVRYLSEVAETVRDHHAWIDEQVQLADRWYRLVGAAAEVPEALGAAESAGAELDPANRKLLERWDGLEAEYAGEEFVYLVRGRELKVPLVHESLSHTRVPKVALPRFRGWGDRLGWLLEENVPGDFPFTAGVFRLKREQEEPTRMFAGEGGPEQTNRRFHYLAAGMPAKRLSTAFDSVTLYGEDPDRRPDIYGKVGNSGVSVCTVDDAKRLYSGFDLCDPATSVSMTINGPAPVILAFFMNAAIDQACQRYLETVGRESEAATRIQQLWNGAPPSYRGPRPDGHNGLGLMLLGLSGDRLLEPEVYQRIMTETLAKVRGTVQADILKEDQAQNTCIFSTEFSLRMMGDVQQYFADNSVDNFYSVSISGYHMAEAGANPITQLAFTLANGFTYVENYLARGMSIDDFAPNLSFFFSNGIDPEYAVIGRVARRIWAIALKNKYGANERSQKLKYHIQTSGRSLHAQEISFNDIRTTLQALYAVYDNCNSLHTNAYDEAITTPTEESVRRALAIQLIINRELGLTKNENPLQGSFIIEELTDLVEEAVLAEFDRLTERGGVLGAMERQYQRSKIQEESLFYEQEKEAGRYPIIGVNTFLSKEGSPFVVPKELVRSTDGDKDEMIAELTAFQAHHSEEVVPALRRLQQVALTGGNLFAELMETVKVASLGQISQALYEVGGRYRRNM